MSSEVCAFTKTSSEVTNYSDANNWLAAPVHPTKSVDIFYLYPTVWNKVNKNEPNICSIDNPTMLKGAKIAYTFQATAFEPAGNVFVPYYRQVDAEYCLRLPIDEQTKVLGGAPKADVFAAFDYYIRNYNNKRPFIIAGHSQGSNIMIYLLAEYMKNYPDVYKRMVAAYVIGYAVTTDYLAENPHLKFATGPDDTGVIISWNTEASEIYCTNPVWLPHSVAINPITWTRSDAPATATQNLGSYMANENGVCSTIMNYADARVNTSRGVVICNTVDAEKLAAGNPLAKGIFHSFDYQFYYFNIRENAVNRVNNYLKTNK